MTSSTNNTLIAAWSCILHRWGNPILKHIGSYLCWGAEFSTNGFFRQEIIRKSSQINLKNDHHLKHWDIQAIYPQIIPKLKHDLNWSHNNPQRIPEPFKIIPESSNKHFTHPFMAHLPPRHTPCAPLLHLLCTPDMHVICSFNTPHLLCTWSLYTLAEALTMIHTKRFRATDRIHESGGAIWKLRYVREIQWKRHPTSLSNIFLNISLGLHGRNSSNFGTLKECK